jgi:hypothetical protein
MRIKQSMSGCFLLLPLNLILLIDVTFSTPTGFFANNSRCVVVWTCVP